MPLPQKIIVSSSFGKDSTAMIHLLLEEGHQIDEIIFFETGWDFPQMEAHIKKVEKNTGITIVRLRYYRHFDEMLSRWGWPHTSGGWCAANKTNTCNRFIRSVKGTRELIGFSADEINRTKRKTIKAKKWKVAFPLIEKGFGEKEALRYCKSIGYDWDGLYDVFSRVSCFCCPKAGKKRIEKLRLYFPDIYERFMKMDEIARKAPSSSKKKDRQMKLFA